MSKVLTEVLADERAWTKDTVDDSPAWSTALSVDCLAELDRFVQGVKAGSRPLTETRVGEGELPACREALRPVLDALERGRGFAIVERAPLERYSNEEAQAMYWAVGQALGAPFDQDIRGTLLYDVRDTGQDVKQGARFSVTNAESSFHTDGAFNPQVPDFIGLLCLKTAKSGGKSQLISAVTLHNELLREHREALETLYRSFYLDRRGQFREGELPVTETPIFRWDGQELSLKYMYYYIQVGHDLIDKPLTPEQQAALEALEALLRREDLQVEFSLAPGQMLFTNNHWILHNRTAFEDYVEPERRRHYVRLWLSRRN